MQILLPTLETVTGDDTCSRSMEQNGLKINLDTLEQIREEYRSVKWMSWRIVLMSLHDAMGDTPINPSSPDDRSVLLYSRKVRDKRTWSNIFNLGHEMRGSTL